MNDDNLEVDAWPPTSPMPQPVLNSAWATTASGESDSAPRSHTDTIPFPEFLVERFDFQVVQGQGGMGVVFKALEKATNRVVAIKVVQPGRLADAHTIQRFAREARASTRLEHAHIVPVYAVIDGPDSSLAIVSRFLPLTLNQFLESRQLTLGSAVQIIVEIAGALGFVHTKKIVHRDVKPGNILIDTSGHAFLTDFGLVTTTSEDSHSITAHGQLLGTPAYMAPEQCVGNSDVDFRSDIYALGVTLFETITGQRAFGGTVLQMLDAVKSGGLRNKISQVVKRCPWLKNKKRAVLITILQKCTALRPQDRYQSATEFAEALADYLASIGDAKNALIHPEQIAVDEVTSKLSNMSSIMEVIVERKKTSLALGLFMLVIVAVVVSWFQSKPSTNAEPQLPVVAQQNTKVEEADNRQSAADDEKPPAKSKFLVFSDDSAAALDQLKEELKKQIAGFKDDDFIVSEKDGEENLRLRLLGYDKKQVEAFLLKLSESKGTPPWQMDIMLTPDVERPKAFVEWAKAHRVFVY